MGVFWKTKKESILVRGRGEGGGRGEEGGMINWGRREK